MLAAEDFSEYVLELVIDTLQQLDPAVQGSFLQKFLKSLASVEISEKDSLVHWENILRRRNELTERLKRVVGLRTAAVDYFGTALMLRNPILLEYQELKSLRRNAATDSLTGLYNRRLFDEYLSKELNRSRRYSYPIALLLFDLRNFKPTNDTYGHATGDEVLRALSRAITDTIRGSDYPCRLGGDEFGVIMPQSEGPSAQALAHRITQKFEERALPLAPDVGLGLDYGVAAFPEDGDSPELLFEVADRRLYAYKKDRHRGEGEGRREIVPQAAAPPAEREATPFAALPVGELRLEPAATLSPQQPQQRRYERMSLMKTTAHGILHGGFGTKVARVADLSFGGVGFLLDEAVQVPDVFHARLHVPILPAAEYRLRRVYTQSLAQGVWRMGCCFAT